MNWNNTAPMTAEDYKENTKNLLDAIVKLTANGTKIWLFDEPPRELDESEYEQALEVNDAGIPVSKRILTGVYHKSSNVVEKDLGYGTYKVHHDDGTYDVKAITKNQQRLKKVTMAAMVITDPHQFAVKCRMLWGGRFGVMLRWTCSEEYREDFDCILKALRNQIFMELSEAMLNMELKDKAKFYWDILQKSNPMSFGKQIVAAEVKAETKSESKSDNTLKITFGDL